MSVHPFPRNRRDRDGSEFDPPGSGGPSADELAEIEREMPLIEAEMALVDAEARMLTAQPAPTALDWYRLRCAEYQVICEFVAYQHRRYGSEVRAA